MNQKYELREVLLPLSEIIVDLFRSFLTRNSKFTSPKNTVDVLLLKEFLCGFDLTPKPCDLIIQRLLQYGIETLRVVGIFCKLNIQLQFPSLQIVSKFGEVFLTGLCLVECMDSIFDPQAILAKERNYSRGCQHKACYSFYRHNEYLLLEDCCDMLEAN
jgi:hypothetical protein